MLIGEYRHSLDSKKRLAIPVNFRRQLGKKVIITRGLDSCLFIYPIKEWQKEAAKISSLPTGASESRGFRRFMFGGAVEAELDTLGRIVIPDFLKDFAGLSTKTVLVGVQKLVEVWDEGRWLEENKRLEKQADNLAQKLSADGGF